MAATCRRARPDTASRCVPRAWRNISILTVRRGPRDRSRRGEHTGRHFFHDPEMMRLFPRLSLVALLGISVQLSAQAPTRETDAQRNARMSWWRDARFGMFIHWGAYAVLAGSYHGQRVTGGEWIMNNAHIPIS